MLAHMNDGQVLVLLKPCSTSELQTIHMGKEEFQRCFMAPVKAPDCCAQSGWDSSPCRQKKGASLAKSLPSQRPLNLAICESSLSGCILPGPFPAAYKAPCLLSPCHLQACGGKVTPSNTMDYITSTRSFIFFIRHSSQIHRLRFYYMEVSLSLPSRFRDTLTHNQGNSEDVLEISWFCSNVGFAKTQFQPGF